MIVRFAGFELDPQRAELRGPDGAPVKLRPKTFKMLRLRGRPPRTGTQQAGADGAFWADIHVGEDSLFQCIREIRSALGDDRRRTIKPASGRGYSFTADVAPAADVPAAAPDMDPPDKMRVPPRRSLSRVDVAGQRSSTIRLSHEVICSTVSSALRNRPARIRSVVTSVDKARERRGSETQGGRWAGSVRPHHVHARADFSDKFGSLRFERLERVDRCGVIDGRCSPLPKFAFGIDREASRSWAAESTRWRSRMDQRDVRAAWQKFVERGTLSGELRSTVAASWQRSRQHRITVDCAKAPLVAEAELFRQRSKNASLRHAARCALQNSKTFLSEAGSIMILTDPTGLIVDTQGDARVIDAGRTVHLEHGGRWSEADIGTNAIGAALAESRPVQIHGAEHFCTEVQRWTCAAVRWSAG